jgi:hypothetical protein
MTSAIQVQLTPNDHAIAAKHLNNALRLNGLLYVSLKVVGGISVILLTLGLIGLTNYHPRFDSTGDALIRNCSAMILVAVTMSYVAQQVARRTLLLSALKLENSLTPFSLSIDGSGVQIDSELATASISWKGIHKVEQVGSQLYLFVSAIRAIIVPQRSFSQVADFVAFTKQASAFWEEAKSKS